MFALFLSTKIFCHEQAVNLNYGADFYTHFQRSGVLTSFCFLKYDRISQSVRANVVNMQWKALKCEIRLMKRELLGHCLFGCTWSIAISCDFNNLFLLTLALD